MWIALIVLAALAQIFYWSLLYLGLRNASSQNAVQSTDLPPLSVIVAARNEEEHLPELLRRLQQQSHGDFEVIVVDDESSDQTAAIAASFEAEDERFRIIQMEQNEPPRKKRAVTAGIAAAIHDHLAFTDADCEPPPEWLEHLAVRHANTTEPTIFAGYSPYRQSNSLQEKLASFETFVTGILTAAAAGLGKPYMAVGRNMSYTRWIFEKVEGFKDGMASMSGDDDLFIQHARRRGIPVAAMTDPTTFIWTNAPTSWRAWLHQKRRHASAGRFYSAEMKFHLTAFHATDLICWLAPLFFGWVGVALLASKLVVQFWTLYYGAIIFEEERLLAWSPLLAPLYALYISVVEPFGVAVLPGKWR